MSKLSRAIPFVASWHVWGRPYLHIGRADRRGLAMRTPVAAAVPHNTPVLTGR